MKFRQDSEANLCVISLNRARNLDNSSGRDCSVIFTARLAGKVVSTEESVVEFNGDVSINQEMAWPYKYDTLVPRNSVRLDCYLNFGLQKMENIGYFIINVKPSNNTIRRLSHWYKIITTNDTFKKCELEVIVYHETNKIDALMKNSKAVDKFDQHSERLESIDDLYDKKPMIFKLDDSGEICFEINIRPKIMNHGALDLESPEMMHLNIELGSKIWKYKLKKSLSHDNCYSFIGKSIDIEVFGSYNKISSWSKEFYFKITIWIGSKLLGIGRLDFSSLSYNKLTEKQKIHIPIIISSSYHSSYVEKLSMIIIGSVKKHKSKNYASDDKSNTSINEHSSIFNKTSMYENNHALIKKKKVFNLTIGCLEIKDMPAIKDEFYFKYRFDISENNIKEVKTEKSRKTDKSISIKIPKSTCTLKFIADYTDTFSYLLKKKISFELWTIIEDVHVCIGQASFRLNKLLESPFVKISKDNESNSGTRRAVDVQENIMKLTSPEHLGTISLKIFLDVWDNLEENKPQISHHINNDNEDPLSMLSHADHIYDMRTSFEKNHTSIDENLEKKIQDIHNEFEWKNEIEKKLINTWKQKENEQKVKLEAKFKEYLTLETKLNDLIVEIEEKKKSIVLQEIRLKNTKNKLDIDYEKKEIALNEKMNKSIFDFRMKLAEKENKISELSEEKKRLSKNIKELESKYMKLEEKFQEYTSKNNPEIIYKLKSEIDILKTEKKFIARELEIKTKNLDDIIKQNFNIDMTERQSLIIDPRLMNSKNELESLPTKHITKNTPKNHLTTNDTIPFTTENNDDIVSSTRRNDLAKTDSVENLVQEIDDQIQQVLLDLEK